MSRYHLVTGHGSKDPSILSIKDPPILRQQLTVTGLATCHSGQVVCCIHNRNAAFLISHQSLTINMLSTSKCIVRNHAHLLASSAAAASIAIAIISQRRKEENERIVRKDLVERVYGSGGLLGLRSVDTFLPSNTSKYCSCESLIPTYGRRQTLRWLDKSSSKETLESRYKVRCCKFLSWVIFSAVDIHRFVSFYVIQTVTWHVVPH